MAYSLRTKLSLSYIIVSLLLVALISFFTNVFLERQFQDYVKRQLEQRNKELVGLVQEQYQGDGRWNRVVIENIGMNALENGIILKVKDTAGKTVWDATVHNSGLCLDMLEQMSQNMQSRYRNFEGSYVENSHIIAHNFEKVGIAEIGYYGPFFFTDNDLIFINTLNRILLGVGIFSLMLALIFGSYMAKRLSRPISRVISAAQMIAKGCYVQRIEEKTNTVEIGQLTSTINELAGTLEKQENLRKRLTADVAHELRTPVATLQSHLEAMIDGIWQADKNRLKSCHEEIVRMGRLVGDLEKLAKYEQENLVLHRVTFDISEHIRGIIYNFESEFRNKGVSLELTAEEQIIFADKDKIAQIVVNLLSNALKYTPSGGSVMVCVQDKDEDIEITVSDNGTGIPLEDLPYIFERFYRADKSRNRLTGGTGIGLAIVKALVEAHQGKISVQSEPGKGTSFVVLLPKD